MNRATKTTVRIVGIGLALYLATGLVLYNFQYRFIFQGDPLPHDYTFQFDQPFREFTLPTPDGEKLSALFFPAEDSARGLVLYFHGNADNLQRWGRYAKDFTWRHYDVLMIDYRGYGKSTGKPTEEHLYRDAETVWAWAQQQFKSPNTIIYGRSLGAAVASHLAISHPTPVLILETPFDEISSVIYPAIFAPLRGLPARHFFSNTRHLAQVKSRKVIIAGEHDWIVPLACTERLKAQLSPRDEFVVVREGGHHNLREFDEYHRALRQALP